MVSLRLSGEHPEPLEALLIQHQQRMGLRASEEHIHQTMILLRDAIRAQGWTDPRDITPESVEAYLLARRAHGDAIKTLQHRHAALRALCHSLVQRGHIPTNPLDRVDRPRRVGGRVPRYTPSIEEVRRLVCAGNATSRKRDRWLVYLIAATCGLRWGTLRQLRVRHAVLDHPTPHFALPAAVMKNRRNAVVYMPAEAARWVGEVVQAWRLRPDDRLLAALPDPADFDRDLVRAGIPKRPDPDRLAMSFHALRYFSATWLQHAQTMSDEDRARHMTHRTVRMTTDVYTDPASAARGARIYSLAPIMPEGWAPRLVWITRTRLDRGACGGENAPVSRVAPAHAHPDDISPPSARPSPDGRRSTDTPRSGAEGGQTPSDRPPDAPHSGLVSRPLGPAGFEPVGPSVTADLLAVIRAQQAIIEAMRGPAGEMLRGVLPWPTPNPAPPPP